MTGPVTDDHLLGGRVKLRQPRDGLRATIDPVLLAAAVPARTGDRLLDGGTGTGAALLCVAGRVPGVFGLGIDRDPRLLNLARMNAAANGWTDLFFAAADLATSPVAGPFDHAFANPPYHAAEGTASPDAARDVAKRADTGMLDIWAGALARPLRYRGTLTFILPPRLLPMALTALRRANAAAEVVFPVWPREGSPARFVLIRGRKGGRASLTLAPGIILHSTSGAFRPEAEAILRDAAPLTLMVNDGSSRRRR